MKTEDDTAEHTIDRARRLRSGQVAAAAGVNVQTLRYYERRGLLAPPPRNAAGHREYPAHTVTLLSMIKTAKRLGLSLNEIVDVITSDPGPDSIPPIAKRKVAEIDAQIAQLTAIREVLATYIR
jgi:DNA-binding transcriptional MerR regulator